MADVYATQAGSPPNSYLPTLVTILECPGIAVALAWARCFRRRGATGEDSFNPVGSEPGEKKESKLGEALMR